MTDTQTLSVAVLQYTYSGLALHIKNYRI